MNNSVETNENTVSNQNTETNVVADSADAAGSSTVKTESENSKQLNEEIKQEESASIFSNTNLLLLFGFLGVFMGVSFFIRRTGDSNMETNTQSRGSGLLLDILFFAIVSYILYTVVISIQKSETTISEQAITNITDFIDNPSSILIVLFVLVGSYITSYLFGLSNNKPISIHMIESTAWIVLVVLLFVDFFKYVFGVSFDDLFEKFKELFRKEKVEKEEEEKEPCPKSEEVELDDPESEVFNVANNLYTYEDAKAVCKVYNAKLATYDQVEEAYNKGAEWCNYGWSEGQLALFPTQKETWNKLQKQDEGKCDKDDTKVGNNCGRPGINGGYIANPYVRFGVNCYGKKPEATDKDIKNMKSKQEQVYPMTPADKKLEEKVDYWKKNANKYLELNSYNTVKWNEKNKQLDTEE
jgi:hypothetical protein